MRPYEYLPTVSSIPPAEPERWSPVRWRRKHWIAASIAVMLVACAVFLLFVYWYVTVAPPLSQTIARIERETEAARGLHTSRPVGVTVLSAHDFERMIRAQYVASARGHAEQRLARIYALLGVIHAPRTLPRILADEGQAAVVGLYVPGQKRLYVKAHAYLFWFWPTLTLYDQFVLAHEYTHALQDQNFGFEHIYPRGGGKAIHNTDQELAIQAIVEGDADETRNLRAQQNLSPDDIRDLNAEITQVYRAYQAAPTAAHVPAFFSDLAAFPYSQGRRYVEQDITDDGGSFSAIDDMYRYGAYPCSTYDILSATIDKYSDDTRGNGCGSVGVPRAATLAGWTLRDSDVMGALRMEEMFGARGFDAIGYRGAAPFDVVGPHWNGDRYALYTKGTHTLLLWHVSNWTDAATIMADFARYFDTALSYDLPTSRRAGQCWIASATNRHGTVTLLAHAGASTELYIGLSPNRSLGPLVVQATRQASGSCGAKVESAPR